MPFYPRSLVKTAEHTYLNIFSQKSPHCLNSNFTWSIHSIILVRLTSAEYGKTKYFSTISLIFPCLSRPLGSGEPFRSSNLFYCRVAVIYVSSSRCRGMVCGCDIFLCLSCPLGSGEPFRSSSCVLLSCGCKCYMSLSRDAVAWSVIVVFSRASHVPWDQVSTSGPLVVFCCRVAVLYVPSSRCRGLVCDRDIFLLLSFPF